MLSLDKLSQRYYKAKNPVIFDFKSESSSLANVCQETNHSAAAHYIHYYPGRIAPHIPMYLLSIEELTDFKGTLLDPFAGSGSILLETITHPFIKRNALGVEINPLARLISKVKTTLLNDDIICEHLEGIKKVFRNNPRSPDNIPDFKNIEIWFSMVAISFSKF